MRPTVTMRSVNQPITARCRWTSSQRPWTTPATGSSPRENTSAPRTSAAATCRLTRATPVRLATSVLLPGARRTSPSSSESTSTSPAATRTAPGQRTVARSKAIPGATRKPPASNGRAACRRRWCSNVVAQHHRQQVERRSRHGERQQSERDEMNGEHRLRRERVPGGKLGRGDEQCDRQPRSSRRARLSTYDASRPSAIGPPTARPSPSGIAFVPGRPLSGRRSTGPSSPQTGMMAR